MLSLGLSLGLVVVSGQPLTVEAAENHNHDHNHQAFESLAKVPPLTSHPEREQDFSRLLQAQPAQQAAVECSATELADLRGQRLVQALSEQEQRCINALFQTRGETARQLFDENQMRTVVEAFGRLADSYQGDNRDGIVQLVLFLRAGYYVQFYADGLIPAYGANLKREVRSALDRFIGNPSFNQINDSHGEVLREVITLIDSAGENRHYLWLVKDMLSRFDHRFQQSRNMTAAVNNVFSILFRVHYDPAFPALLKRDSSVVDALYRFTEKHQGLLGSKQEYVLINAVRELGRFLQYPGSVRHKASGYTRQILQRYEMTGKGASLWVVAASFVDGYDKANCADYGICNFRSTLERHLLPHRHECSPTLVMRAQRMSTTEFRDSCRTLARQESEFHSKLKTQDQPVADDHNTRLEVVVFDSSSDYQSYAGVLYGISTDNGGMYLEGDPSDVDNQARFIAYEAEWKRPEFVIWNLEHEFVHYLDGRFNLWGDFGQSIAEPTVWWIEGLAEYISKRNDNPEAVMLAGQGGYSLSELFGNRYSASADRTYRWGYLAVRYMFERKHQDVSNMLDLFRNGRYEDYRYYIEGIGRQYDADFARWLQTVDSSETEEPEDPDCTGDAPGDFRELVPGQKKCAIELSGESYFYLYVSRKTDHLRFDLETGEGEANLFVSRRSWPSPRNYEYAGKGSGTRESIRIESPQMGDYYMVHVTHSGARDLSLSASLEDDIEEALDNELANHQPRNFHLDGKAYFYIWVPEDSHWLYLTLNGGQSQSGLYVKHKGWPDSTRFDQISRRRGGAQQLLVSPVKGGSYYHVMVETEAPALVTLKAQVQ